MDNIYFNLSLSGILIVILLTAVLVLLWAFSNRNRQPIVQASSRDDDGGNGPWLSTILLLVLMLSAVFFALKQSGYIPTIVKAPTAPREMKEPEQQDAKAGRQSKPPQEEHQQFPKKDQPSEATPAHYFVEMANFGPDPIAAEAARMELETRGEKTMVLPQGNHYLVGFGPYSNKTRAETVFYRYSANGLWKF